MKILRLQMLLFRANPNSGRLDLKNEDSDLASGGSDQIGYRLYNVSNWHTGGYGAEAFAEKLLTGLVY